MGSGYMIGTIWGRLKANYRKALWEASFLKNRCYPDFIFEEESGLLDGEIPVFLFHTVRAEDIEEKLKYLVTNGYRTIGADELYEVLTRQKAFSKKTVMLTFDDGRGSLWSVAYPLLKKYGMVGVAFIVPTWVHDHHDRLPNLTDYWKEKASFKDIEERECGTSPFVTWDEIQTMHDSGVIDFQSHSLTHGTVFTSEKIVEFVNPKLDFGIYKNRIPVVNVGERNGKQTATLGLPIYTVAPRLTGARRYWDDEPLRERCTAHVKANGEANFFTKSTWRKELAEVVGLYRSSNGLRHRYETDGEREKAIMQELEESKVIIEKRLGKTVRHLCYPYFAGSEIAAALSKRVGYKANYWGWWVPSNGNADRYGLEHSFEGGDLTDLSTGDLLKGRRTNRPGDDPYRIVRLPGDYIFRLPGKGRRSLTGIIAKKCFGNLTSLGKR